MHIQKIIDKHYAKYLSKAKEDLITKLKHIDNKLFKKKSKNLIVKDYCIKTIWTPQTDLLTFSRRRYYDKKKQNYRYLLDEYLHLDKYKFISKQYQKLAIFNFDKFRSYKDMAQIIYNQRVSKMSIHNFIKNYIPSFSMDNFICNNDGILWINCDGMWIKKNKTTKAIEVKNFVFFSDRKLNHYSHKWELKGKTMAGYANKSFKAIINELEHIILQYDDVREIRLVGDGAKWIKEIAKALNAIYYINKFHVHKSINDLVGIRNNQDKQTVHALLAKELPKTRLRYSLLQLVANRQHGEVTKTQLRIIGYIVNNSSHYIRNIKYDNPINCIEAMQAHYQARYFKNQRKGWSIEILNKLITFVYSKINGGASLEIDIGDDLNYPQFNTYGINASIPGIEDPYLARILNKKW